MCACCEVSYDIHVEAVFDIMLNSCKFNSQIPIEPGPARFQKIVPAQRAARNATADSVRTCAAQSTYFVRAPFQDKCYTWRTPRDGGSRTQAQAPCTLQPTTCRCKAAGRGVWWSPTPTATVTRRCGAMGDMYTRKRTERLLFCAPCRCFRSSYQCYECRRRCSCRRRHRRGSSLQGRTQVSEIEKTL